MWKINAEFSYLAFLNEVAHPEQISLFTPLPGPL